MYKAVCGFSLKRTGGRSLEAYSTLVAGIVKEKDPSEIAVSEGLADLLVVLLLPGFGLTFLPHRLICRFLSTPMDRVCSAHLVAVEEERATCTLVKPFLGLIAGVTLPRSSAGWRVLDDFLVHRDGLLHTEGDDLAKELVSVKAFSGRPVVYNFIVEGSSQLPSHEMNYSLERRRFPQP